MFKILLVLSHNRSCNFRELISSRKRKGPVVMTEPIFLRITFLTYIITGLDCLLSDEHHELVSVSVLTVKAFKTRVHRVFPCVRIVRTDDLLSLLLRSFHCHIVFIVHELSLGNNKNFLHIIISFQFVSLS